MTAILALEVVEPGERAGELLAAIAAKLHLPEVPKATKPWENLQILVADHPAAVEAAEDALDEAGDEGRLIVRVLRP